MLGPLNSRNNEKYNGNNVKAVQTSKQQAHPIEGGNHQINHWSKVSEYVTTMPKRNVANIIQDTPRMDADGNAFVNIRNVGRKKINKESTSLFNKHKACGKVNIKHYIK